MDTSTVSEAYTAPSSPTRKTKTLSNSPPKASILRRTSSSVSAPSHHDQIIISREKKVLRFTQVRVDSSTVVHGDGNGREDRGIFFPGEALDEGQFGKRRERTLFSEPATPNFQETADQIKRTISLASLDSLALLSANQMERTRFIAEVSKAGRDLVWRDQSERRLLPSDNERAFLLALKRGLRSFLLAFSVRSGINVLLLLFRLLRRRRPRLSIRLLLSTIFSIDSWRFAGMLGTFTYLYTLTLHLLRLAPPLSYYKRRIKHGLWNKASFGPPEREGTEGERRWQAAVAGAVGSLGLLWETASRRTGVSQQMFVRGLQAAYNQYTPRLGLHIPHGDILLFGACCGQIMFSFLMSPETIPREYNAWILSASRVPGFAVAANKTNVRQNYIAEDLLQKALSYKTVTPINRKKIEDVVQLVRTGLNPPTVPCGMVHPWSSSCIEADIRRFFAVFRFMLPVYSALHIIPMMVLRRHHVKRDPLGMLARAGWGITRSCSFLGMFVMIFQTLFCARSNALEKKWGTEGLRFLLKKKEVFWGMGFATCLSLLLEEKKRRAELAMYVLPRALESAWSGARKRAWVPIVPFGETILGMAAMSMVMDAYKHQPNAMSGIFRRLLFQLVGPV